MRLHPRIRGPMDALTKAVAALQRGELVAMPTETVYGLAADARRDDAVLRIFSAKGRPRFDPLIVHIADAEDADRYVHMTPTARRLAAAFWPGPLTLVLERRPGRISDLTCSGLPTLAVRCPDHELARALIRAADMPLAAPSANPFGRISPTTAAHVVDQLGPAVSVILDGGACRVGVESTIIRPDPIPTLLRPGGVAAEAIESLLGTSLARPDHARQAAALAPEAPGMLASHYAPRTPLILTDTAAPWPSLRAEDAVLAWRAAPPAHPGPCEILSENGDLAQAASRLFAALRRLDASPAPRIIAECVPEHQLGAAINDRLRRAAHRGEIAG